MNIKFKHKVASWWRDWVNEDNYNIMALRGQYNLNKTTLGNEYKKDKSTNN